MRRKLHLLWLVLLTAMVLWALPMTVMASGAKIVKQPESVQCEIGNMVAFCITTEGAESVWWEYQNEDDDTWQRATEGLEMEDEYDVIITANNERYVYRAAVQDSNGDVIYSDPFCAFVPINISEEKIQVEYDTNAMITLEDYRIVSREWYVSSDGGTTYRTVDSTIYNSSYDGLYFNTKDCGNDRDFYCEIETSAGCKLSTRSIHINVAPNCIFNMVEAYCSMGETITLQAAFYGASAYQWQYSTNGGSTWKNSTLSSAKKKNLTLTVSETNKNNLYRCRAEGDPGAYTYASPVSLIVMLPGPKITSLTTTSTGLKLTWEAVEGAAKYCVWRRTAVAGSWKRMKETTSLSYTNTGVTSGTRYYYKVVALDSYGNEISDHSEVKNRTFLSTLGKDDWKVYNVSSGMKLTWTKVTGADGYYIYRKASTETAYTKVATIKDPATLTYTDTDSVNGTIYYYRVRAYKGTTLAGYYSKKTVRLRTLVISTMTQKSDGKVFIEWDGNPKADGYELRRSYSSAMDDYTTDTITTKYCVGKTLTGLKAGRMYAKVRSYKIVDGVKYYSGWSTKKSLVIK